MATSLLQNTYCFLKNGTDFSHISEDGKIKIWDTTTSCLKQEFTKNFHLSVPITSISSYQIDDLPKRKKKKLNSSTQQINNSEFLALGTLNGRIILFDVVENKIIHELEEHSHRVNNLSFANNDLFSCSDDKTIIQWNVSSYKIKSKFKDKNDKIKCILPMSDGVHLLSASFSIKLWSIENKQILKTFSGHATEVTSLVEVPGTSTYFISASMGDRVISAWSLASKNDHAVSSFLLKDNTAGVQVNTNVNNVTTVSATTVSGSLHLFKHQLNGVTAKPIKPKQSVSVVNDTNGEVSSLPIIAHYEMPDGRMVLAYGSLTFLTFEIVDLNEKQESNIVLVREQKKFKVAEFNSKTKIPEVTNDVEYATSSVVNATGRKRTKQKNVDVALEDRLENLALVQPETSSTNITSDNMSQLLIQGLQSKDKDILHSVLLKNDQDVVTKTIKSLPINAVVPLIKELIVLMQGRTYTSRQALLWLKVLLKVQAGYLIANPHITEIIQPLLSSVESRLALFPPLLRLSGRINLVTEQIDNNIHSDETKLIEPLLIYHDREDEDDGDNSSSSEDDGENGEQDSLSEWNESSDNGMETDT